MKAIKHTKSNKTNEKYENKKQNVKLVILPTHKSGRLNWGHGCWNACIALDDQSNSWKDRHGAAQSVKPRRPCGICFQCEWSCHIDTVSHGQSWTRSGRMCFVTAGCKAVACCWTRLGNGAGLRSSAGGCCSWNRAAWSRWHCNCLESSYCLKQTLNILHVRTQRQATCRMTCQQGLTQDLPTVQAALRVKETKGSGTCTDQTWPVAVEPMLQALPSTHIFLVHSMVKGHMRHGFCLQNLNHSFPTAIQCIIDLFLHFVCWWCVPICGRHIQTVERSSCVVEVVFCWAKEIDFVQAPHPIALHHGQAQTVAQESDIAQKDFGLPDGNVISVKQDIVQAEVTRRHCKSVLCKCGAHNLRRATVQSIFVPQKQTVFHRVVFSVRREEASINIAEEHRSLDFRLAIPPLCVVAIGAVVILQKQAVLDGHTRTTVEQAILQTFTNQMVQHDSPTTAQGLHTCDWRGILRGWYAIQLMPSTERRVERSMLHHQVRLLMKHDASISMDKGKHLSWDKLPCVQCKLWKHHCISPQHVTNRWGKSSLRGELPLSLQFLRWSASLPAELPPASQAHGLHLKSTWCSASATLAQSERCLHQRLDGMPMWWLCWLCWLWCWASCLEVGLWLFPRSGKRLLPQANPQHPACKNSKTSHLSNDPSTRPHAALAHCSSCAQGQRNQRFPHLHWSNLTSCCWTNAASIAQHTHLLGTFHGERAHEAWILLAKSEPLLSHCHPVHHRSLPPFRLLMMCSNMWKTHPNRREKFLCSRGGILLGQGNWFCPSPSPYSSAPRSSPNGCSGKWHCAEGLRLARWQCHFRKTRHRSGWGHPKTLQIRSVQMWSAQPSQSYRTKHFCSAETNCLPQGCLLCKTRGSIHKHCGRTPISGL